MKIVREHINEKFVEDSDPIRDMGIGMFSFVEKFIKEHENSATREEYLWACAKHGYKDGVEYLLSIGDNAAYNHSKALCVAVVYRHIEIAEMLLKAGANPNTNPYNAINVAKKNIDKRMLKLLKKYVDNEN